MSANDDLYLDDNSDSLFIDRSNEDRQESRAGSIYSTLYSKTKSINNSKYVNSKSLDRLETG